ncbi:Zinc finger MYM-type protein 6 [Dictyocoela muelleri]|nr:Zinc finger MYM-type protein 6 [Dictyocoela muelleri]
MAEDVEEQLIEKFKNRKFSIQIDESTVNDSRSLLMSYSRFIDDDFQIQEEMLFLKYLKTDTTGASIFEVGKSWFKEKQIPIRNLISCATDGAPVMIGGHKGFIIFLKNIWYCSNIE